ncbi:hypothetical protein EVAR_63257_1 [Eumeta japonica]|uniref:Uncharacterized protein n=1 Tax=Eumeta variegata TaxID=151549 RepID=A0A4C2A3Q5_EUMVA|nr:hypothetical protein EVAR_63257_1 [Eumeta japonica]
MDGRNRWVRRAHKDGMRNRRTPLFEGCAGTKYEYNSSITLTAGAVTGAVAHRRAATSRMAFFRLSFYVRMAPYKGNPVARAHGGARSAPLKNAPASAQTKRLQSTHADRQFSGWRGRVLSAYADFRT